MAEYLKYCLLRCRLKPLAKCQTRFVQSKETPGYKSVDSNTLAKVSLSSDLILMWIYLTLINLTKCSEPLYSSNNLTQDKCDKSVLGLLASRFSFDAGHEHYISDIF